MDRIVSNLLELARHDEGRAQVGPSQVVLRTVVDSAWAPLERPARAKGMRLAHEVDDSIVLTTDRDKLLLILSNLFANAVSYSPEGSTVQCRAQLVRGRLRLEVSNPAPDLEAADLEVMFDRFWRKDAARSGDRNLGLGLALVRAFADLLELKIEAELGPEGRLSIALVASPGSASSARSEASFG
jgi:two-component system sensor histidine kinase QseC